MDTIRLYATVDDITDFIQSKLGEKARDYSDCQWYPINMKVNENDFSVDFILAAVKNSNSLKELENRRIRIDIK